MAMDEFGISRQAVLNHVHRLVDEGLLVAHGETRARRYELRNFLDEWFSATFPASEDVEWRQNVLPLVVDLPENVRTICQYGFSEMLNNAIDHSEAYGAQYHVLRNAIFTRLVVLDRGIGIFKKIQIAQGLEDQRHAILELSKGKLTTAPDRHTGEGVFFTSRMFDQYRILSGALYFSREKEDGQDWLVEVGSADTDIGTMVLMTIRNDSSLTMREVFDQYAGDDFDNRFAQTVVPVELSRYEGEKLVSRSQARRLVARFDRFSEVILDFNGVTEIGPAFADEVFRVYQNEHPEVHLRYTRAAQSVRDKIDRVLRGELGQLPLGY